MSKRKGRKGKNEAHPNLCEESPLGAQKGTGLGYLKTTKNRGSLGSAGKGQLGLGQIKESMPLDIRNEDGHIPSTA